MIDHVKDDADRPNELVTIGSRWFGWRHHWTVMEERRGHYGVREVRFVRDDKPGVPSTERRVRDQWLPAWRIQRFCDRQGDVEVPERERTRSKRIATTEPKVKPARKGIKRKAPVKPATAKRKRKTTARKRPSGRN
jgi:hypothetical protein